MKFLEIDSPFMRVLGTMADLIILNLLTVLLCIPIVTAGAAFTAMHYVMLKIVRNEEGYIVKTYFRVFKENFVKSTFLWLFMLIVSALLFVDWRILMMQGDEFPAFILVLLIAAAVVFYLVAIYIFPVLSRYENTIRGTLKTAFSMSVLGIFTLRTIASAILIPLPFVLMFVFGYASVPVFAVFCFSGPAFFRAKLYSGLFKQYEEKAGAKLESAGDESDDTTDNDE